jgi:hypothetical protein
MSGNILNDYRFSPIGSCTAGTHIGTNLQAIDRLVIGFWEAGSSTMPQINAVFVEQQEGTLTSEGIAFQSTG